jgi:hypothetical protein
VILYRKSANLRIKRATSPAPPFWFATAIAPYSPRRASPVAIDYLDLVASEVGRAEVSVCESVSRELEGARINDPVLIEATEFAETIFRRGEEALKCWPDALHLISTRGAVPEQRPGVLAIATWPLEFERLEKLFANAREYTWGAAIPVMHPVTTDLEVLERLADLTREHGASFFASITIDIDPTAKQVIAASNEEAYALLFHGGAEALHVATERHIAALAAERGMSDFITPPQWEQKSNWNAAVLLTLTATRMIAMDHDVELAGTIARSARVVAELDKPIERIAEAASLSIVESLDEASIDILSEWLESGRATFAERVNREWRLRRDAGLSSE